MFFPLFLPSSNLLLIHLLFCFSFCHSLTILSFSHYNIPRFFTDLRTELRQGTTLSRLQAIGIRFQRQVVGWTLLGWAQNTCYRQTYRIGYVGPSISTKWTTALVRFTICQENEATSDGPWDDRFWPRLLEVGTKQFWFNLWNWWRWNTWFVSL